MGGAVRTNDTPIALLVEQMTLQKGSKNGDSMHGGITKQNWYQFCSELPEIYENGCVTSEKVC